MRRAAIVSPVRTPVGAFGGALRDVPVETLGSAVTKAVLERTGRSAWCCTRRSAAAWPSKTLQSAG